VDANLKAAAVAALETVPGLIHGFEQRHDAAISESREQASERVTRALMRHGRLHLLAQVHGAAIHVAPWDGRPEGDAGVATQPGLIVGVETADCLPILLVDPVGRRAAAVHAGWRGTAAHVAKAAVAAFVSAGATRGELIAALGPGIGACCYEVGNELREVFGRAGEGFFREGPRGRPHLDVRAANVQQLLDAGLVEGRIHHVPDCTSCRADLYFSFRRDGKGTGRMINYVGWVEAKSARSS
jgi:polyphenol oxidase